jgi:hypothetical protein
LAGCGKDERFRVSFNSFHRIFVIFWISGLRCLSIKCWRADEATRSWRKIRAVKLHNLCYWPNINMIKSRRMRLFAHLAHMREMKNTYRIFTNWKFLLLMLIQFLQTKSSCSLFRIPI